MRPERPRPAGHRGRGPQRLLAVLALAAAVAGAVSLGAPAGASVGSDEFHANRPYRGDFPDPAVMRVGSTYYAYSTTTAGKLLPAMTSTDLRTWTARHANTDKWWENDALTAAPSWAKRHYANGAWRVTTWAPSVSKVEGGYVAAYATPVSLDPVKMCVTLAYSTDPLGPFTDRSSAPFVCRTDVQGSIDPYVYIDRLGDPYLLWKNEGIPHHEATRIWTRKLNRTATAFAPGSVATNLLTTALPWEGNVIENPAMIRVHRKVYLFYSANRYKTADYAIGYARCKTPVGPCTRPTTLPLLASGGAVSGPGGPNPFKDASGGLRLAYAAWDLGRVGYPATSACRQTTAGCNQRRLHVATLRVLPDRTLAVTDRG